MAMRARRSVVQLTGASRPASLGMQAPPTTFVGQRGHVPIEIDQLGAKSWKALCGCGWKTLATTKRAAINEASVHSHPPVKKSKAKTRKSKEANPQRAAPAAPPEDAEPRAPRVITSSSSRVRRLEGQLSRKQDEHRVRSGRFTALLSRTDETWSAKCTACSWKSPEKVSKSAAESEADAHLAQHRGRGKPSRPARQRKKN
jgi:hypothetical protein